MNARYYFLSERGCKIIALDIPPSQLDELYEEQQSGNAVFVANNGESLTLCKEILH